MIRFEDLLRGARDGDKPSPDEAMTLAGCDDLAAMMAVAAECIAAIDETLIDPTRGRPSR